ncbi:MAG: zinc metallopeptidase [Bacteroidales bacterium]|nr:zinc metallopeptidase [Bacteroidales bacterium]
MRLTGRRESTNVDDRRRSGGGVVRKSGLGIGGVIIVALLMWAAGGNPLDALQYMGGSEQTVQTSNYTPSAQEQELATFAKQILASTEEVWTAEFKKIGRTYQPPTLVLFTGSVQSGCGGATASSGPFYCSADQRVYIDLSFFTSMKKQLGADGDFAYAYVIAHEVGHHVQHLLGTLDAAHNQMARSSETVSNQISVRLELQADFYAGVWGYHENQKYKSLEDGDIEEALGAAKVIGDDYLQKKSRGYTVPESFNHGTSSQRFQWLRKGLSTGDIRQGDTFSQSYSEL